MVPMHAIERILASHAGRQQVSAGELITVDVDLAGVNDLYLQVLESFQAMGGRRVRNPERVVFFFDHYAPPSTIKSAENQRAMRTFVEEQGIERLLDVDEGVCHQALWQHGWVRPGMLVVITDSHATTHGAFGAFSTGVGATDMAGILLSGKLWLRVPEVIRVEITGDLPPGTMAKDVILRVLRILRADGATYKAVEFCGPGISSMSLDQRTILANMSVELGAKASFIPVDGLLESELMKRTAEPYAIPTTDPDYQYAARYSLDVSALEPQIARPGAVDDVVNVASVLGTPVDQAYVGGCTGGLLEDMAAVASQLHGAQVHKGVRFVVSPASSSIYLQAIEKGYIAEVVRAGGTVINPGCGPCLGVHQGILAAGEVCVSAASRNFPGRMGSTEAQIYLASPATAAASAIHGRIALPAKEGS
jgi:homoaconitate hydratase family protein